MLGHLGNGPRVGSSIRLAKHRQHQYLPDARAGPAHRLQRTRRILTRPRRCRSVTRQADSRKLRQIQFQGRVRSQVHGHFRTGPQFRPSPWCRWSPTGCYDKIHLFDPELDGVAFEASNVETPGRAPVLLRHNDLPIGLTIYDVRFSEIYRALALAGAGVFFAPSAFAEVTPRPRQGWLQLLSGSTARMFSQSRRRHGGCGCSSSGATIEGEASLVRGCHCSEPVAVMVRRRACMSRDGSRLHLSDEETMGLRKCCGLLRPMPRSVRVR